MSLQDELAKAGQRLAVLDDRCRSYERQIVDASSQGAVNWAAQLAFVEQRHRKAYLAQSKVVQELQELVKRQADFVSDALPSAKPKK